MLWAISCVDKPNTAAIRDEHLKPHREYLQSQKKILVLAGATQKAVIVRIAEVFLDDIVVDILCRKLGSDPVKPHGFQFQQDAQLFFISLVGGGHHGQVPCLQRRVLLLQAGHVHPQLPRFQQRAAPETVVRLADREHHAPARLPRRHDTEDGNFRQRAPAEVEEGQLRELGLKVRD